MRSILKPTIPLSPPKPIPPYPNSRELSPAKSKNGLSPKKSPRRSPKKEELEGTARSLGDLRQSGLENLPNPFDEASNQAADNKPSQETRVAVRTEEQQQAAAKERERKELVERRDARRKSLGECDAPRMFLCLVVPELKSRFLEIIHYAVTTQAALKS